MVFGQLHRKLWVLRQRRFYSSRQPEDIAQRGRGRKFDVDLGILSQHDEGHLTSYCVGATSFSVRS
jgi:hypothetical protein